VQYVNKAFESTTTHTTKSAGYDEMHFLVFFTSKQISIAVSLKKQLFEKMLSAKIPEYGQIN